MSSEVDVDRITQKLGQLLKRLPARRIGLVLTALADNLASVSDAELEDALNTHLRCVAHAERRRKAGIELLPCVDDFETGFAAGYNGYASHLRDSGAYELGYTQGCAERALEQTLARNPNESDTTDEV